jgi:hypothetical protein
MLLASCGTKMNDEITNQEVEAPVVVEDTKVTVEETPVTEEALTEDEINAAIDDLFNDVAE